MGHEAVRVELARAHADRAHQQCSPAIRELAEQALQRRAAVTERPLGLARHGKPHGLLGEEHADLTAPLQCRARDEERDRDALSVLHSGRQVDQHLPGHGLRPFVDPPAQSSQAYAPSVMYIATSATPSNVVASPSPVICHSAIAVSRIAPTYTGASWKVRWSLNRNDTRTSSGKRNTAT